MDKEQELAWFNFDLGKYEFRQEPATDEETLPLLPPGPQRDIYKCYRMLGDSIMEAMRKALVAGLPKDKRL